MGRSVADTFDIVVAGAGRNSLVGAAYLAKAGFKYLILEAHSRIGGDTRSEELTGQSSPHDRPFITKARGAAERGAGYGHSK